MSHNVREVVQQQHAVYDVSPYYILYEDRPKGATAATRRRIQAGFDIDVYVIKTSREPGPSPEYGLVYAALRDLVQAIMPRNGDSCIIQIIPFASTVFPDTRRQLQSRAMLRIRVTHGRGLDQPSGVPEERALKEVQQELHELGVKPGK
jgi:hypothetical protein